jgi:hypothetical protein
LIFSYWLRSSTLSSGRAMQDQMSASGLFGACSSSTPASPLSPSRERSEQLATLNSVNLVMPMPKSLCANHMKKCLNIARTFDAFGFEANLSDPRQLPFRMSVCRLGISRPSLCKLVSCAISFKETVVTSVKSVPSSNCCCRKQNREEKAI